MGPSAPHPGPAALQPSQAKLLLGSVTELCLDGTEEAHAGCPSGEAWASCLSRMQQDQGTGRTLGSSAGDELLEPLVLHR